MDDIDDSSSGLTPRNPTLPAGLDSLNRPLNLTGSQFVMPLVTDTEESSIDSPTAADGALIRAESPALSISTFTSIDTTTNNCNEAADGENGNVQSVDAAQSAMRPAKRRKLSPDEKLMKEQQKQEQEKEKAEKKALREEERRIRDKEKQRKAEDRENKRRVKELEEERKVQEKLKKERAQTKLGAFFQPKTGVSSQPSDAIEHRRLSISAEALDIGLSCQPQASSPSKLVAAQTHSETAFEPSESLSDYQSFFLPFVPPSHSHVWSVAKTRSFDVISSLQRQFDADLLVPNLIQNGDALSMGSSSALISYFGADRDTIRGLEICSMRTIVDHIHGNTHDEPVDLTSDVAPLTSLQKATRRIIQFDEDVRPPYSGTYTKIRSAEERHRSARNPFRRMRRDTDYEYDSEIEWEEPEEGEDILADDEDDAESMGDGDDMDEFLDDDDDSQRHKRKIITGDLQPANTGLCWENQQSQQQLSNIVTTGPDFASVMTDMKITFLLPGLSKRSIDPFSIAYWQSDMAPPIVPAADLPSRVPRLVRPPLTERNSNSNLTQHTLIGAAEGEKGPITSVAAISQIKKGRKPSPKVLDANDMENFKDAVNGSPLPKLDLLKGLKQRFPKITNEVIKDTLATYFAQQGTGKSKKWIFTGNVEEAISMSGIIPLGT